MQEQLRSYLIAQELGWKLWWKYAILFADNLCHEKRTIDRCVVRTLVELKVSKAAILKIDAKVKKLMTGSMVTFLKENNVTLKQTYT
jgi:hypothetical protein